MSSRFSVALIALAITVGARPAQVSGDTLETRLATIEAAQTAARDRFSKELQQAEPTEAGRQPPTDRFLKELDKNVEAALLLARENPGHPTAFEALKFVVRANGSGPGDGSARALRLLLDQEDDRRPGQGDYLGHVALRLFQYPDAEVLLRRILERNPSREDRAAACYWLAHHLAYQAKMVRRLREKPDERKYFEENPAPEPIGKFVSEKDPDALDKASEALLERAVAEFGDVTLSGYKRPLATFAGEELFAARNLGVGKPAPEIAGVDHEGKPFKLSESRGKVVVLTFSGNWCGPCVAMYPQERSLLEKFKDRPFTIVSVVTDEDVETVKKSITSGKITWRCWWDGGTDGPITTRWGIVSFPSIFVLDPDGIIRYKNLRGDDLDQAVDDLLNAVEPAAPR